ncbi:hypothetical protein CRT60_00970 [Azospirillum palustre]|uniref:Integrase n=1 Tax=Azospirillum palustre TaxID=2044885 RepID=A0A2B8BKB8_9PROT|nr:tyrosine-type recombinase/integrase [Azospirillum palustre]PGH59236.1 hypothetical protein CRT60_00970 [Azospirillum palustre]
MTATDQDTGEVIEAEIVTETPGTTSAGTALTVAVPVATGISTTLAGQADNDDHLVDLWINSKGKKSRPGYARAARFFREFLADPSREAPVHSLARVRVGDLQAFVAHLETRPPEHPKRPAKPGEVLGANTRKTVVNAVKSLLSFGHRIGYLPFNVGSVVKGPGTAATVDKRILSVAQVHRLLDGGPEARNRAIRALCRVPGIRLSHLTALTWGSLTATDGGGLAFVKGRGQRPVGAPIDEATWNLLMALKAETRNTGAYDPVFQNERGGALETEEARHLVETQQRDAALVNLAYACAGRISELVGLKYKDLRERDGGAGTVHLFGKGGKSRWVRLPKSTWVVLMALQEENRLRGHDVGDEAPVFRSRKGGHLDPSSAHAVIKAAAARAGLKPGTSMHWLRHSHASHALKQKAPVHLVKESLGHSNIATTDVYLHIDTDESSSDYLSL